MVGLLLALFAFGLSAEPKVTQKVFFDIAMNGTALGRIVLGLYGDLCPKVVENFYHLSICDLGKGKSGLERCYKGIRFHSMIQDVMFQAGDYYRGWGGFSESIWGGKFADDNLELNHTGPGVLSMANGGKDSNGSQFIITLKKTEYLDGKHEVFGRVMSGMSVLAEMNKYATPRGRPTGRVGIADCGAI